MFCVVVVRALKVLYFGGYGKTESRLLPSSSHKMLSSVDLTLMKDLGCNKRII